MNKLDDLEDDEFELLQLRIDCRANSITRDEPFDCERASQLYFEDKERVIKNAIADRNAQTRLDEQLRKERLNERFWHRVYVSAHIFAALLVIYTIFHFA